MKIMNSKKIIPTMFALLFAVVLLMAGCSNMIVDLTGGTAGGTSSAQLTGISAVQVLGKTNFTDGEWPTGITSGNINCPKSVLTTEDKLYIVDWNRSRILGYNTIPTANGADADFVLGQPDFTSEAINTTATGLAGPHQITTDGTHLIVADFSNFRVLIWNSLPTTTAAAADVVVGQADMTSFVEDTSATRFRPMFVAVGGGKMLVTDYSARGLFFLIRTPENVLNR